MTKHLMKGNDAVIRGALLGGATEFFGYPITPASEIAHAAAFYFPLAGHTFLQAECEVNAINMLYGASAAGSRVMTASAGPGVALMAEGLSYLAGAELPNVVIDVQRAGPGLGNIWPEQSDYNMVVKGGGNGNYKNIVLAPNSVQEMCDFTYKAFDLADKYRMTVFIMADAYIGQMMEPVELPKQVIHGKRKDWAIYADKESRKNLVTSIFMSVEEMAAHNQKLCDKYERLKNEIVDFEEVDTEDADILLIAYGISARISLSAVKELRAKGIKAGLLRPKTLFPFPSKRIAELSEKMKKVFVVELSEGQMLEDVKLAIYGKAPIELCNWMGGMVPSSKDLINKMGYGD
ncbi:MAG: 3-methyl-2-oxobutanoate dehydrogenase subunit VorB [Alphaproteobacteria bacterium]|nr:3-methyl-2-oxobutanoate dehydrogenase subunit VorB [Alphaproteobacteria bacterium]